MNKLKLAVLSTFTAEPLKPFWESIDPWFGPFGQLEQMVLDGTSELWRQSPDALWIALRIEDVDRWLTCEALEPDAVRERLAGHRRRVVDLARAARGQSKCAILVANFLVPSRDPFDAANPDGVTHLLAECNQRLARELNEISDCHVFDYAGRAARAGTDAWSDPKLWHLAKVPCSSANMPVLAAAVARQVTALFQPAAKCIVVDLDGTLWDGVLGDEGIEITEAHRDFQAALLGLRSRGFLLAIASKNDLAAVLDALAHPDMVLKREHFAAIRADWQPKSGHLPAIAAELNVGTDALVFVDDNPLERAAVRSELPMVHVIELPSRVHDYVRALAECPHFDRPRLTTEDRARADMYRADAERKPVAGQSMQAFLESLDMEAEVGLADEATLPRIHQLINKTNQFNLTGRRYEFDALRALANSPEAYVAWLRLQDRYGAMGIVAAAVVDKRDGTPDIQTFVMSCRVMGRGVEQALLAYLADVAGARGASHLHAGFRPTAKNIPAANFYPEAGFVPDPNVPQPYTFSGSLSVTQASWPSWIRRAEHVHV